MKSGMLGIFRVFPIVPNVSNQLLKLLCVLFFLSIEFNLFSQNCNNVGFEDGRLDGYEFSEGVINFDGTLAFKKFYVNPTRQQKLMFAGDIDSVALQYCDINKILPVVSPFGGMYSMRLGDSTEIGAKAGIVRLKITVTPDFTFFLLRYAVVLNDPGHADYQQPRFEIRILDANGKIFPCGEYLVHAGKNLPNFESCRGNWRVQSWTTVGFELKSYLGQTIEIQMLTTDCAMGAHAGYAYVDAECQPLEIKGDVACDGSKITLNAVKGFVEYKWSTGDTTESIIINHPVTGSTYSLTVTGATGCKVVLNYTVPDLNVYQPKFDALPDTTICQGKSILISPTGKNIYKIFCKELGYEASSFLLSPQITSQYTFIATDNFACNSDTLHFNVNISDIHFKIIGDSLGCPGDEFNFQIENPKTGVDYIWYQNGLIGNNIKTILDTTTYIIVRARDNFKCTTLDTLLVKVKETKLSNNSTIQDTILCPGTAIWIYPQFKGSYKLFCNELAIQGDSILISAKPNSQYTFITTDSAKCKADTLHLSVKADKPDFKIYGDSLLCAGEVFHFAILNPLPNAIYTWLLNGQMGDTLNALLNSKTSIIVNAKSAYGCSATDTFIVQVKETQLSNLSIIKDTTLCPEDQIWIYPDLKGNYKLFCVELGTQTDSILIQTKRNSLYTFITKDTLGCKADTLRLTITMNEPDFKVKGDSLLCPGEEFNLNIANPDINTMYTWFPVGQTGSTFKATLDSSTTIIVKSKNQFGCTSADTVVVLAKETKLSNLSIKKDTTLCPEKNIWIKPNLIGDYKIFCKELGIQSDSILISAQNNALFTFITTDNTACKADTLQLFIQVANVDFKITGDSLLCAGEEFNLNISKPQPNTNYTWLLNGQKGNNFKIIPDTTLDIIVRAENNYGCASLDTFVVHVKETDLSNRVATKDTTLCLGEKIWIHSEEKGSYKIFCKELTIQADSILIPTQINSQYTFITTDSARCKADTLKLKIELVKLDFDIVGDSLLCSGDKFNLHISNPQPTLQYIWFPGNTKTSSISGVFDTTITYSVEANYLDRCSLWDTFIVKSKQPFPFVVNVSPDTTICLGDKAVLNVNGSAIGNVYWKDFNQNDHSIIVSPTADKKYELIVKDNAGCDSIFSRIQVNVINTPIIELGDPVFCAKSIIELDAKVSNKHLLSFYNWNWNNGSTEQITKADKTGLYKVEVSNECGVGKDSVWVSYQFNDKQIYFPNIFSPNGDGINDFFKPVFNYNTDPNVTYDFRIYDRWGELVYSSSDVNDFGWDGAIKGQKALPGVYVWYLIFSVKSNGNQNCDEPQGKKGEVTLVR